MGLEDQDEESYGSKDKRKISLEDQRKQLQPFKFNLRKFLAFVGPGFLMSIAYLDPGNIAGDLDAGVKGNYGLIWLLLWATMLGLFYQCLALRIGVVTQRDLAKLCAQQFSTGTRYALWIMIELAIIGSDIQEVLGSATALHILFGVELWVGALITILDSFLFLFIHYYGIRKLEAFFAFLISVMALSFMVNMFTAKPEMNQVLQGTLIPSIPKGSMGAALGLVGAVIMPHNLYLHSSLVLTRKVDMKNKNEQKEAIIYNNIESAMSLFVSFLISASVIATFAVYSVHNPENEKDLDLLSASDALKDQFGDSAKYIWAIGLLAAGQSSTMTGTYAGQFVMEGFLDFSLPIYQRVFFTRMIAIVPSITVTFFNKEQLTNMDTALNILQSVQLPFALIPLIKFASSPKIMGIFAISSGWKWFSISLGFLLSLFNIFVLLQDFEFVMSWQVAGIFAVALCYLAFIVKAIQEPISNLKFMTEEELRDHEYEQVIIDEQGGTMTLNREEDKKSGIEFVKVQTNSSSEESLESKSQEEGLDTELKIE